MRAKRGIRSGFYPCPPKLLLCAIFSDTRKAQKPYTVPECSVSLTRRYSQCDACSTGTRAAGPIQIAGRFKRNADTKKASAVASTLSCTMVLAHHASAVWSLKTLGFTENTARLGDRAMKRGNKRAASIILSLRQLRRRAAPPTIGGAQMCMRGVPPFIPFTSQSPERVSTRSQVAKSKSSPPPHESPAPESPPPARQRAQPTSVSAPACSPSSVPLLSSSAPPTAALSMRPALRL